VRPGAQVQNKEANVTVGMTKWLLLTAVAVSVVVTACSKQVLDCTKPGELPGSTVHECTAAVWLKGKNPLTDACDFTRKRALCAPSVALANLAVMALIGQIAEASPTLFAGAKYTFDCVNTGKAKAEVDAERARRRFWPARQGETAPGFDVPLDLDAGSLDLDAGDVARAAAAANRDGAWVPAGWCPDVSATSSNWGEFPDPSGPVPDGGAGLCPALDWGGDPLTPCWGCFIARGGCDAYAGQVAVPPATVEQDQLLAGAVSWLAASPQGPAASYPHPPPPAYPPLAAVDAWFATNCLGAGCYDPR
jgi:hypothetical protein